MNSTIVQQINKVYSEEFLVQRKLQIGRNEDSQPKELDTTQLATLWSNRNWEWLMLLERLAEYFARASWTYPGILHNFSTSQNTAQCQLKGSVAVFKLYGLKVRIK